MRRALAMVAVLVAGCSTDPASLKAPSRDLQLELAQPFVYEAGGSEPMRFERSLVAGTYLAVAEDARGVFLQGPSACYRVKVLDPGSALREDLRGRTWTTMDCGIYLPNNAAVPAKIYVVLGTASPPPSATWESNAALLSAILAPGAGTIQKVPGAAQSGFAALEGGNFNFVTSPPGSALRERLGRPR